MIRWALQPEELIAGYWPRAARLNGVPEQRTIQGFKEAFLESPWAAGFGAANINRIAGIAAVEWPELIQQHTMLPYQWAVSREGTVDRQHFDRDARVISRMAFTVPREGAAFCPCCVEEDVAFHGFSIWRREHQVPGAYWCLKHEHALVALSGSAALAMLCSPASHLASGEHSAPKWVATARLSSPIRRVLEIESFFLERRTPLAADHLINVARVRAAEIGLRTDGFGSGPLLSDLARDKFEHAWLAASFPSALNPIPNANCRYIDLAIHHHVCGMGPIAYAIMFAAMWDTTDDALNAMLQAESQPRIRKRKLSARPTDQAIRDSYKQHLSARGRMIRQLGTSHRHLSQRLRHLGLPVLEGKPKMAMAAFLIDGLPIETAAQQWEIAPSDLENLMRDALAPIRDVLTDLLAKEPASSRLAKRKRTILRLQAEGKAPAEVECDPPALPKSTTKTTRRKEGRAASSTKKPPRTSRQASNPRSGEQRRGSRSGVL